MIRMNTRIALCLLVGLLLLTGTPQRTAQIGPKEGVLRLHILANSDSEADQAVKLLVRDALLPLFKAAETYEDARSFVLDHGKQVLAVCQETLASAGAPYGVQLLLGVSEFPDRRYNGVRFPAGAYDALRIVLGDGAGHNWWCVLFPPLCVVTADGAAPEANVPITFESDILAFFKKRFGRG